MIGLLCTPEGCPVAVEVLPGNTSDPNTLRAAVIKTRERVGSTRVVFVGDRGLITDARITDDLQGPYATSADGLAWITALRVSAILALVEDVDLQFSLFEVWHMQRALAPIFFANADPTEARAERVSIVARGALSATSDAHRLATRVFQLLDVKL